METALFTALALCVLGSALAVVRASNLIHATLWLGASLLATAAVYAAIGASFLAAVQVLVYVGGVVTLMVFGVMMTRRHEGIVAPAESHHHGRATVITGVIFAVMVRAIRATRGLDVPLPTPERASTPALGRSLVIDHVLAFEALSVLLLAAIVGAVVLARRRDPPESRTGEVTP